MTDSEQPSMLEVEVALLRQHVKDLDESVELLTEYVTGPNVGGPWFWPALTEPQQLKLLADVADFVDWLHENYLSQVSLLSLPTCWWRHSDVRDQLIALMVAHKAVYTKKAKAASDALVDWHERALWPVMERIERNRSLVACKDGTHEQFISRHQATFKRDEALVALLVTSNTEDQLDLESDDTTSTTNLEEPTQGD